MLAARRALAVVVSARVSRRGVGRAATKLSVSMASVGARRCSRNGTRCARRHDRRALDEVGGAIKERRARGSARARRRRVGSSEPARRGQSSNEAEREYVAGRRSAVRPERRTLRTTARSARARRGRRRDQGTACSRLGARSPSWWRTRSSQHAAGHEARSQMVH